LTQPRDYYRLLQVDPSADQEVVEAAYRRLARKYHPDLNPGDEAGALMRRLNEAYAILKDPNRRAAYDRERSRSSRAQAERAGPGPRRSSETRRAEPRRPEPRIRPTSPRPEPWSQPSPATAPTAGRSFSWAPARRELLRLGSSLSRNRIVLTTAACALIAAATFAAFAARLFTPGEVQTVVATSTPGIVVVNRAVPLEPTATPRVRLTATAEPWPPFPLDRPVPADESAPGGAAAVGSFLSRAGQDLQRRLLGGPRPPSTPAPPS
jgi:hypothetical protein